MYYFAYGSNMNFEHMRKLCGWHFTVLGTATLPDYKMDADLRGYINIQKVPGSKVMGVLYDIDQEGLQSLDEFEGCPHVFKRELVKVKDQENTFYDAWVYIESPDQFGGDFVRQEYLNRVLLGATENRLPEDWIAFLKTFGKK